MGCYLNLSKFKEVTTTKFTTMGSVLLNDGKLLSTISFFRTMEPWFLFHERGRDQKSRYLFSSTPTKCLGAFISKGCILFVCYHITSLLQLLEIVTFYACWKKMIVIVFIASPLFLIDCPNFFFIDSLTHFDITIIALQLV